MVGFVATGLSFAKALTEYVQDWRAAPQEIRSLPPEIENLLDCVNELEKLLEKNESTQVLMDTGVRRAHKNIKDCKSVVDDLRKLLSRGGVNLDVGSVTKDDLLDLDRLRLATWPLYKNSLVTIKARMLHIGQQITITMLLYQMQARSVR